MIESLRHPTSAVRQRSREALDTQAWVYEKLQGLMGKSPKHPMPDASGQ